MYLNRPTLNSIALSPIDGNEIVSIVHNLKNKPSTGYDQIGLDIIKKTIYSIIKPLSFIINQCFDQGIFPNALKIAQITPIFKTGNKSDIANYRPISVLSSFSKIFEKAISIRLISFLDKNYILSRPNQQFGFRKKHSTHMALLDFYDKVTESIESNNYTVGIFIDLQKAFDTIDHSILIKNLDYYGIRGTANILLRSYLTNRKQCVKFNNTISSPQNVLCGVPQGSILGPILFILYTNDLQNCLSFLHPILFADDTNLIASANTWEKIVSQINNDL
jgi:hypothetical protein